MHPATIDPHEDVELALCSTSIGNTPIDRVSQLLRYNKNVCLAGSEYYERKEFRARIIIRFFIFVNSLLAMLLSQVLPASQLTLTGMITGAGILLIEYLQNIVKTAKYPVKKDQLISAAEQYEDLETKLDFGVYSYDDPALMKKMQTKILQVRKNTKVRPPLAITRSFTNTS